jgi:molybdate/tungstate transport system substrate-binding protein
MTETVEVLYAGSLTHLMDTVIGPAFQRTTGIRYQGQDGLGGAVALARAIRDGVRRPDVFLPADGTQVNPLLMPPRGNWSTWYVPFARVSRVLTYSPLSRWRADFERAARGEVPWYEVLLQPGLRFGRSDPDLDPGGYLTLFTCQLAEWTYAQAELKTRLLGPDRNPAQMPPVEVLRRGLSTGELDATIGYRLSRATTAMPSMELPAEVSLSDPLHERGYARASYATRDGIQLKGGLVYYTATVLAEAPHPDAGAAFVAYLLSEEAQTELRQHGLASVPPIVRGASSDVPARVAAALAG